MVEEPGARGDAPMLLLPVLYIFNAEQEIGALADLPGDIDDAGGRDKVAWLNGISRVIGEILACDPVDRGIEVRPSVLAQIEDVPVPGRAALRSEERRGGK